MGSFVTPVRCRWGCMVAAALVVLAAEGTLFAQFDGGGPALGPALFAPNEAELLNPVTDEPELAPVTPEKNSPGNRATNSPGLKEPGRLNATGSNGATALPGSASGPQWRTKTAPPAWASEPNGTPRARRASADGSAGVDESDPAARPLTAAPSISKEAAGSLMNKAYARSRAAKDEAGYTEAIELCRATLQAGVRGNIAAYMRRLMAWCYNRRGELHAAAGRDNQAFEDFDAAVDMDNQSWRALHNRGVSYVARGKSAEALADFTQALDLNSDFGIAHFNRAEVRYDQGDFEGAIADYDDAVRLMPGDAGVLNSRGHAHFRLKHFKEAVADFNETLRLDPRSAAAMINRGDVYAEVGYFAEAVRDYQDAIRVRPQMGRAYQSAAWLMATCPQEQFRDPQQAIEAARRAIELDGPNDHRYLATLAAALASAGQFEEAEATQRQATLMAPEALRLSRKNGFLSITPTSRCAWRCTTRWAAPAVRSATRRRRSSNSSPALSDFYLFTRRRDCAVEASHHAV